MEREKINKTGKKRVWQAGDKYPGVAIDVSDDNKVSEERVCKANKYNNNNPRGIETDSNHL